MDLGKYDGYYLVPGWNFFVWLVLRPVFPFHMWNYTIFVEKENSQQRYDQVFLLPR